MEPSFQTKLEDLESKLSAYLSAQVTGVETSPQANALKAAWESAHKDYVDNTNCLHLTTRYNELAWCLWGLNILKNAPQYSPFKQKLPPRAGYLVQGEPGQNNIQIFPYFMAEWASVRRGESTFLSPKKEALSTDDFPDAWAVAPPLWLSLEKSPSSHNDLNQVASLWLKSPARLLIFDINTLQNKKYLTPETLTDAACLRHKAGKSDSKNTPGHWLDAQPAQLRPWQSATPGTLQNHWTPPNKSVALGLDLLTSGKLLSIRAAALRWLMDQCGTQPIYTIGEGRRDLRQDLAERLQAMASVACKSSSSDTALGKLWKDADKLAHLENTLLAHASLLLKEPSTPTSNVWALSKWIHRCLWRSPFVANDAEMLGAKLEALLPPKNNLEGNSHRNLPEMGHAFFQGDGLSSAELAFVSAVAGHYTSPGAHLLPTPPALVKALQHLANRPLRQGEEDSEFCYQDSEKDSLPLWPFSHLAPPWIARWLLSNQRITWLQPADMATHLECQNALESKPLRFVWLINAVQAEGSKFSQEISETWLLTWRALSTKEKALAPHELALMASGLLPQFEKKDLDAAFDLVGDSDELWRPYLLESFAIALDEPRPKNAWKRSLEGLQSLLEDKNLPEQIRLDAALMLLRQATKHRKGEGLPFLETLSKALREPPFSRHTGLSREISRLHLSPQMAG